MTTDERVSEMAMDRLRSVNAELLAKARAVLAALPGFEVGPQFASTALIDCSDDGPEWAGVVGGAHGVFEELS